ncbi:hypothetical protein [Taibaiella helva]|uniref:hypothetical protein n=1 Tax=Taibaiella helva TaxID=2301235 RepID=UPI000E570017|nr:hypothetical protein [Taibaiella helva]
MEGSIWQLLISALSFKDTRLLRAILYFLGTIIIFLGIMNISYQRGINDLKKSLDTLDLTYVPTISELKSTDSIKQYQEEINSSIIETKIRLEFTKGISYNVREFEKSLPKYDKYIFFSLMLLFILWGISRIKDYFTKHPQQPTPNNPNNNPIP